MTLTGVVGGVETLSGVRVIRSELDMHHVALALYRLRQLPSTQLTKKGSHCIVIPDLKKVISLYR